MDLRIDDVVVPRDAIAKRVAEMAKQIADDFTQSVGGNAQTELTVMPILTGAFVFAADLIRQLPIKTRIEMVAVRSYPGTATESQGPQLLNPLPDLSDQHVLLVEDILDSGQTLTLLKQTLAGQCASLRMVTLLRKQRPQAMATPVDFVGFDIPDVFVVGYGLDHDGYHRNLPDVVHLKTAP